MVWPSAVINVVKQKNVAVSGKGVIDCRGKKFWEQYWKMRKEYESKGLRWAVDYDCKRVRGILVERSTDVTLKRLHLNAYRFLGLPDSLFRLLQYQRAPRLTIILTDEGRVRTG